MNISDSDLIRLKESLASVPHKDDLEKKNQGLANSLEAREKALINLVNGKPSEKGAGSLEHATSRYLLQRAHEELLKRNMVTDSERQHLKVLDSVLKWSEALITPEIWERLVQKAKKTGGFVGPDGAIWGLNKYEQLDDGWLGSITYLTTLHKITGFVKQKKTTGISVTSDKVRIALVGDWGTGPYKNADGIEPSTLVMESIAKQHPDYAIHLGDVYYNGTSKDQTIAGPSNQEQNNLVNVWTLPEGRGFALNSNHEMYSGGYGLFNEALTSPKFSLQEGASYFALVHKNWVIFGLDSAYYDHSLLLQDGALTDENQLNFIKGIDTTGKKVIVMTHHNGLTVNGKDRMPLWQNVKSALNRDPDFWYWGHVHNAIAYSSRANVGSTIARCVGHGAIPFTKATDLYLNDKSTTGTNHPEIAYYAGQELPVQPCNGRIQLAKNGYAILTITADSLTEVFYDLNGNVVWSPSPYKFGL